MAKLNEEPHRLATRALASEVGGLSKMEVNNRDSETESV